MRKLLLVFALLLCTHGFATSDSTGLVNQISTTATGTSTKILNWNGYRNYLLVQNNGTDFVIVKFGAVQSGTEGVKIPPGGAYEPAKAPNASMYVISASSTQAIMVLEGQWQ